MTETGGLVRPPRTVLEQVMRDRRETAEEFSRSALRWAREHRESGRIGARHVQRLASGRRADGRPLGPVLPATRRLLEGMLGMPIDVLLGPPKADGSVVAPAVVEFGSELRALLSTARRVDPAVVDVFRRQLAEIRSLDRQIGALAVREELAAKAEQVRRFLAYATARQVRRSLAGVLVELHTLAGWQSLDIGCAEDSWRHYECAKSAAREAGSIALLAHAAAEQAFVLLDVEEVGSAVEVLGHTRRVALGKVPAMLAAWLSAAYGEALAAAGDRESCLRVFDDAERFLSSDGGGLGSPYLVLDVVHLARWRGHALARFGDPDAIAMLRSALARLDSSFSRAASGVHADLALALAARGQLDAAQEHAHQARELAAQVGSRRQQRRLAAVAAVTDASASSDRGSGSLHEDRL